MSVALLGLRLIAGALFAGHGSQKLFDWFKGHGLSGTGSFFESVGLTPGAPLAFLADSAELFGGLLLALGLALPLACLLLVAVMVTAIAIVHWKNGVWAADGGFEFPLVLGAVAFAVTAIGAGRYSLDNLFRVDWASLSWAIGATIVGAVAALAAVMAARMTHRSQRHAAAHRLTRQSSLTTGTPRARGASASLRRKNVCNVGLNEFRQRLPIGQRKRSRGGVFRTAISGQVSNLQHRGRLRSLRSPPASEMKRRRPGLPPQALRPTFSEPDSET